MSTKWSSHGLLGLRRGWTGKCVPVKFGKRRGRVCVFKMKKRRK